MHKGCTFRWVKMDTVILTQGILVACTMAALPLCLQILLNIYTCSNGKTTEEQARFI